jgi:hypothetical protein
MLEPPDKFADEAVREILAIALGEKALARLPKGTVQQAKQSINDAYGTFLLARYEASLVTPSTLHRRLARIETLSGRLLEALEAKQRWPQSFSSRRRLLKKVSAVFGRRRRRQPRFGSGLRVSVDLLKPLADEAGSFVAIKLAASTIRDLHDWAAEAMRVAQSNLKPKDASPNKGDFALNVFLQELAEIWRSLGRPVGVSKRRDGTPSGGFFKFARQCLDRLGVRITDTGLAKRIERLPKFPK